MMLALIGMNANAAIYLIGDAPMGGWNFNGSAGIEMEDNGDGTYSYVVTIGTSTSPKTVYFAFADGWGTSWDDFNYNHRYGPQNGGQTLTGDWASVGIYGDRSFKFMGTGEEYKVTFDLTNLRAKIEGYVAPVEITTYTVVTGLNDWAIDEANDMSLENGVYTLSMENVQLSAGTFGYKIVGNHDWGNEWPQGYGNNFNVEVPSNGIYNLTFTFDPATGEATCAITPIQELDDYYIVAGTENMFGSNWSATDTLNLMTEGEAGMFTWTKEGFEATAGTEVMFKVVANGNWDTCWPLSDENGDNNWWYQFAEDGVYTVVITFNEETKEINLVATRTGDLPEPPQPEVDDVYIIGDVNNIGWSATEGVQMTYNEGIYTAEITTQNQGDLGVAYFGFTKKLADPESTSENIWDDIEAYRFGPMSEGAFVMTEALLGQDCELDLEGSYNSIAIPEGTWTVTVDLANGLFSINGAWPTDTVVPEPYTGDVYILGDVNDNGGWFTNVGVKMTRDAENNVYTATITTTGEAYVDPETNIGYSYFSFTKQLVEGADDWEGIQPYRFGAANSEGDYWITDETTGIEIGLANGGASFAIPAGEWNLTVSVDNMTLIVEKAENVLIGDANGDGVVNPTDATVLINALLSENFEAIVPANSDMDGNGTVNVTDAILLINYLLTL